MKQIHYIIGAIALLITASIILFYNQVKLKEERDKKAKEYAEQPVVVAPVEVVSYEMKGDSLIWHVNNPHPELAIQILSMIKVESDDKKAYELTERINLPSGESDVLLDLKKFWPERSTTKEDGLNYVTRKEVMEWMRVIIVCEDLPVWLLNNGSPMPISLSVANFKDGECTLSNSKDTLYTSRFVLDELYANSKHQ